MKALLIVLVTCAAMTGCASPPPPGTPAAVATTSAAPATSNPLPTPIATTAPPSTATPSGSTLAAAWTVPFILAAPVDWKVNDESSSSTAIDIFDGSRRDVLSVILESPASVDDVVTNLTTDARLEATEPQPAELGGASGYALDLRITIEATACTMGFQTFPFRCVYLHDEENEVLWVQEDRTVRVWIVSVDGETLMVWTDARDSLFADWEASMADILGTLEWTTSS